MERQYNITWKINDLAHLKEDGLVVEVNWSVKVEAAGASIEYADKIKLTRSSTFIPLDELTESLVIGWVKDKLGDKNKYYRRIDTIINGLKAQVDSKLDSPIATGLPW